MLYKWLLFISAFGLLSCSKSGFLDKKPDEKLVLPQTLDEFQAILDNDRYMNGSPNEGVVPSMGEYGADDFYCTDASFLALHDQNKKYYTWAKSVYTGIPVPDWDNAYRSIFYANFVLEGLSSMTVPAAQSRQYGEVRGGALFFRAHSNYQLSQIFAPPYDPATAVSDMGIPLRQHADINEPVLRSTNAVVYEQIVRDLTTALPMLPDGPLYKTRPSKAAAWALLARTYQTMQDPGTALRYADSAIALQPALMDYNTITNNNLPFTRFNAEVILNMVLTIPTDYTYLLAGSIAKVDSNLYKSYDINDLRRTLFFRTAAPSGQRFKGTYDGGSLFGGLAVDEVYLIKAESEARLHKTAESMLTLNTLLKTRWKTGLYIPFTASSPVDALQIVLRERRKELLFRGLRWTDLRRLRKEPGFDKMITRVVNGTTYQLLPGDLRYTYPIPSTVINFHPDMIQNPR